MTGRELQTRQARPGQLQLQPECPEIQVLVGRGESWSRAAKSDGRKGTRRGAMESVHYLPSTVSDWRAIAGPCFQVVLGFVRL